MKASSVGLEVFIEVSSEELDKLKTEPLGGNIKFMDNEGSPNRKIPFTITLSKKQREFLIVEQEPSYDYFGKASYVEFSISRDYYTELIENGSFGYRFSTGGKLIMRVEGRYTPY